MTVSTHVLDAGVGRPAAGVPVSLSFQDASLGWRPLESGETDGDGRHRFGMATGPGVYRLVFGTGAYFAACGVAAFYPEVTITFTVADGHYHVPLLLSPFAYSTYRGSLGVLGVRPGGWRLRRQGMMGHMGFELTEQIERHLIGDQIAWFTTVTPSGRPAPRPVWFVWDGTAITIYGLNRGVKQRHIAANNKVTVHFDAGPGGSDIVVISGRAELVPGAPPPSRFPGLLDKYLPALESMGQSVQWYDGEFGVAIRVTPERARAIP